MMMILFPPEKMNEASIYPFIPSIKTTQPAQAYPCPLLALLCPLCRLWLARLT